METLHIKSWQKGSYASHDYLKKVKSRFKLLADVGTGIHWSADKSKYYDVKMNIPDYYNHNYP